MWSWIRRLRARLRYGRFDRDLRDELATHASLAREHLETQGIDPGDARRQAARQLGNVTLAREEARAVWIAPWLESVWQDVRYSATALRRTPGFALTALAMLSLGIGLNTSLFGLVNGLLLRPWPVPQPHEVVAVYSADASSPSTASTSAVEYRFLRDNATTIDLVAMRSASVRLGVDPDGRVLDANTVSGNYFASLRMPIALGRGFRADEDLPGRPVNVAIVSHSLWGELADHSPDILGRTLRLNDLAFAIVGVVARGATDSAVTVPDVWLPLATTPAMSPDSPFGQGFLNDPQYCCVRLAGRLRQGATREAAAAELSGLDRQFREPLESQRTGMIVTATSAASQPGSAQILPIAGLILAGLALVLVVATANLGNLLLARAMARRDELRIRCSLGASRSRLVRQLMTECALLAAIAATISFGGAFLLPGVALGALGNTGADVSPDGRVVMFAGCAALLALLVSGLAPAWHGTRRLAIGTRPSSGNSLRLRSGFLAAQVALSAVLLVGAALMSRSVVHAATVDPGYRIDGIAVVRVLPPLRTDPAQTAAVFEAIRASFRDAGLRPPAEASYAPLNSSRRSTGVRLPGESEDTFRSAYTLDVSPEYFGVLGIPVQQGRGFAAADAATDVVVNESLARQLWPDGVAAGRTVIQGVARRVAGVVSDAHLSGLTELEPTLFRQALPGVLARPTLLLEDEPDSIDRIRAAVAAVEPEARVIARPLRDNLVQALQLPLIGASIATSIGMLAVVLAAVGIFGVFSYAVNERTREIGIRMALGARSSQVIPLVLRQAGWPLLGGLGVGLVASWLATPVLRAYLLGISPYDGTAFTAVAVVVVVAAVGATWLPARRATRIDPAVTLRAE